MRAARGKGRVRLTPVTARVLVAVAALGFLTMVGAAALAFWPSAGTAAASVTTGSLNPPTNVSASSVAGSGSAAVTWTGSTGTTVPEGFYVVRTRTSDSSVAPACGTSPTSLTGPSAVSCTDTFVPVGTYTYAVTAVHRSWTAPSASSAAVVVVVADHLAFTAQPGSGTGGTALASQPTVTVQDFFGGTETSYAGSVTLALTTPGGATLSCTANPKTVVVGVATFAGCKVDKVGTYTMTATAGSLASAVSSSFTITVGAANKLVVSTQPGSGTGGSDPRDAAVVTVQDAGGNTVTTDTSAVTLALTTAGWCLAGLHGQPEAGHGRCGDVRGLQGRQGGELHADRDRRSAEPPRSAAASRSRSGPPASWASPRSPVAAPPARAGPPSRWSPCRTPAATPSRPARPR